jgi:predicted kinase
VSTAQRRLILINGQPGSGKTTLKRRLVTDLDLPALSEDDIKEHLFDTLGVDDKKWPGLLGKASSAMLALFAQKFLEDDRAVIAESAFMHQFAQDEWAQVQKTTRTEVLELYCQMSPEIRRQRFDDRIANGDRHTGHIDGTNSFSDAELAEKYAPLNIGKVLYVDTTKFDEEQYAELLTHIRTFIERGNS